MRSTNFIAVCSRSFGGQSVVSLRRKSAAAQRARLSNSSSVAKPIELHAASLGLVRQLCQQRTDLPEKQCAERALRGFVLGRKSWLFAGSERGADRAAVMATLIMTAKLNLDPQAWLADVLAGIASTREGRLNELLPWQWKRTPVQSAA
ncbi:hypothetical protein ABIE89_008424 [Bradyrhizobium niftali]